ncbi:permease prefix domain 1-containing protein [Christensenellaceae bacterium OttesenSCG-928-K19]|nr:permease prefix domain 1-containing protein [Christensenellaceae bacterium OttesenSCG-928-K19]
MEERLKKYVDNLFADAPKTKKAVELRQEIYTNLVEKYQDLLKTGATQDEAYEIVKNSIGNVDELIDSLYERSEEDKAEMEITKRKRAKYNAVSASLYIASPIFIIAFAAGGYWLPGVILLLACIAAATGIRIYSNTVFNTAYEKMDDTMVEEFKEWKAENKEKVQKKNVYSGTMWLIIVIIYFLISFTTMAWGVTWLIFLVGAAIEQIIKIQINK